MSSNPYENEPGYERANSEADKKAMDNYIAKVKTVLKYNGAHMNDINLDTPRDASNCCHSAAGGSPPDTN